MIIPTLSLTYRKRSTSAVVALASRFALLALVLGIASHSSAQTDSIEAIVQDFLDAGLVFQNHDPTPYLYIGDDADVVAARAKTTSLEDSVEQLREIQVRLLSLAPDADAEEEGRRASLNERLTATITRGEILLGARPADFQAESRLVFGVEAPIFDEEHFRNLTSELAAMIPGDGPLVERVETFRDQFIIPKEKLELVIGRAMQECRERTQKHVELPADEQVTLNITSNQHWVGFTEYRGNSHSIVHLNADVPVHIERAIELGCHEGYPGHHVHATLVEQELIKNRGWKEYNLVTLLGPYSVITEGAASYAENLVFTRSERMMFDRDVLMPLAGLDTENLALYYNFIDLVGDLNFARNTVASAYLYGGLGREDAIQWLMEFGLETRGTASQRLDFIDVQRAYVITYNYGKQLVSEYIGDKLANNPDQAWREFIDVLLTPLGPQDLIDATQK